MILSYDIAVDLTPEFNRQLSPKFSVSLGDHGAREYTVRILQGGEPYEIEEGSTVSIVGKKSDGHIFAYACTYADEYVYFTIEEQMTPVSGIVTCELSIIDASGNKVGSANFTYWVEPSPVTDGEASESDLQLFQQLLDAADDLDDVREILDRAVPIAEQLGDVEKLLTAFPTEETSGSIITLTDGADGIHAKKMTLSLSPHQSGSGDPSPENVRPISGYTAVKVTRAGKNVLPNTGPGPEYTQRGITFTKNADGTVAAAGTADGTSTYRWITQADSYTLPQGTYKVIFPNAPSGVSVAWSKTDGESGYWYNNTEFTLTHPVTYNFIALRIANGTTVDATFSIAICSASFADDTYEPYAAQEYDITIPTAAGTVYGGSLEINGDGSGTLTVNRGFITLNGTETWTRSSIGEIGTSLGLIRLWTLVSGVLANYKTTLCNQLPTRNDQTWTAQSPCSCRTEIAGRYEVVIDTAVYADADAWKAHLAQTPLQAVFYTTPTTYTLTAEQVTTLLGDNTLWMDADGSIDLTYRADTQKYIDSRIALLNSNLAYIEDGMTASRAYSVGQYVLIGGQLYRVTSAISSGATFTIGTNVVSTTVGAELTALNN